MITASKLSMMFSLLDAKPPKYDIGLVRHMSTRPEPVL
jgi:hypothetical protein